MSVIERYAGLVLDLDGVVFRGEEAVPGAPAFLGRMREGAVPVVFVTNNSTRTAEAWTKLFSRHRIEVDVEQIVSSAVAAADLLASGGARVFVIGERGLVAALDDAGVEMVEDQADADTVVVGWDKNLTYDKLRAASIAIHRGCRFVGTNPDLVYPSPDGPWPGNGASLAYLHAATGVAPEVVGKPRTPLLQIAAERLDVDGPVLVIGDQVSTDVMAAANMGWDSALVLSGVDTWASLIGAAVWPKWIVPTVGELDGPEPPVVRPAEEADLPTIRELLRNAEFDESQAARRLQDTLVAEAPDGSVVATVAWDVSGSAAQLCGIATSDAARDHRTRSHLAVRALGQLQNAGVDWVCLLAAGADELFLELGFSWVDRDRLPAGLHEAEFGGEGLGTTALVRRLRGSSRGGD